MIGKLPKTLTVNGKEYAIRTDYRDCLLILQAFIDANLNDREKSTVMLQILYKDYKSIPQEDIQKALEKAVWFLNCGDSIKESKIKEKPLYDFEHDEQMLFSAVNKVAGTEIRSLDYLHFWTFIGFFNEIGEGMFATVINIRNKKNKHQKLEKWEQEFYAHNKEMIDLPERLSKEEKEEQELVDTLFF